MRKLKYDWLRLRWIVLERDDFTCQYCGQRAPDVVLHVDHKIALVDGGTDDEENLVAACTSCNLGKEHARFRIPKRKLRIHQPFVRPVEPTRNPESLQSQAGDLWTAHPEYNNKRIAEELNCRMETVRKMRRRFYKRSLHV